MEDEETLMIGIDTSSYMKYLDPHRFELLIQCVRLYCQLQIESNPKIAIGILTMGCNVVNVILQPTRSIKKIMDELQYDNFGLCGPLKFVDGFMTCMTYLSFGKKRSKRERIALFTGGSYIDMNIKQAEYDGKLFKNRGVKVDLFNFKIKGDYFEIDKLVLDAFVDAAVGDKTKHIAHISTRPTTKLEDIINSVPQFFKLAKKDQVLIAKREKVIDCKADEEEYVRMSENEFTHTTVSSKRKSETSPDAIDVESTPSSSKKTRQSTDYISGFCSYHSTGCNINQSSLTMEHSEAVVTQTSDGSVVTASSEEERLWSIVNANSLDFNAWTALIDETEKTAEVNVLKIRKVYDTFLSEFPLCYGYWKKYADHEAELGYMDKAVDVYERAVHEVTYSVDMWLHYCVFAINTFGDVNTVQRLFEKGLAYVGTDYLSFTLWDKYIEYEYQQQHWSNLASIYTRILEHPNQHYERYFNSFRDLVASLPLSELQTPEELAAAASSKEKVNNETIEGESNPNAVDESSKPANPALTEAEELESYIAIREEHYKKAKEFVSEIIKFETAIRRPYFHVGPLCNTELENWHNYLDFVEGGDDFNKVVKLYERCLIACANYPEYWVRYVLWLEASGHKDLAENALARAKVFVKQGRSREFRDLERDGKKGP